MAISFVGVALLSSTTTDSSFTIQKPSGVTTSDLMVAVLGFYSSENGSSRTVSPPAGWTLVEDRFQGSTLNPVQLAIMSRVATASEPGSWTGSYSSSVSLESACTVAYRGAVTIAVDGSSGAGRTTSLNTPSVSNPAVSNWRMTAGACSSETVDYDLESNEVSARGQGPAGITGSYATTVAVWDSNGTIPVGSTSRQITRGGSWSSAASWVGILGAADTVASGTFDVTLKIPVMSAAAEQGYTGTMASTMPVPTMTAAGEATAPSGTLGVLVTPSVDVAAYVIPTGAFTVLPGLTVSTVAETRRFGIRVIDVEAETRRVVPKLGTDTISESNSTLFWPRETAGGDLLRAKIALPQIDAVGSVTPASILDATMPRPGVLFSGNDGSVYVVDYTTPQLAANAASGKHLVFPANQTYDLVSLSIPANCYIEGNGSTLRLPNNTFAPNSSYNDELLKVTGSGVTIDGLNFDGNAQNQGAVWSEFRHCVRIEGAYANTVVKNCTMTNIIGDGVMVYVGSQTGTRIGPNNSFNGAHFNRNGVSVVTGVDVEVFTNTFTNCTRSGMPSPIDIEPNVSGDTLSDIRVHGNTIVGGSTAGTGTLPGITYAGFSNCAANAIQIYSNDISGTRLNVGVLVIGNDGGPFNAATNIDVYSNNIHDIGNASQVGVNLVSYIGADVYNNTFNGMESGIYNYQACLGTSTGNTFTGVTNNIVNDSPHCS